MAKGSEIEVIVFGLGSLFCLWAFGKMWFIRVSGEQRAVVRQDSGTWDILYAGLGFAIEAAQLYYPRPSNFSNAYYWGFGIVGIIAVCHHFWSRHKAS